MDSPKSAEEAAQLSKEMIKDLLRHNVNGLKENSDGSELGLLTSLLAEAAGDLRLVRAEKALEALAGMEEEPGLNAMVRYLAHHPSAHVRSKIALLMGRADPDVERVRRLLATSDGRLRANSIESLWGSADPAALDLFREAASDPCSRAAINALVGLSKAGDAEAYARLEYWAACGDPSRCAGALWAIRKLRKTSLAFETAREDLAGARGQVAAPGNAALSQARRAPVPGADWALLKAAEDVLEQMCFTPVKAMEPVPMPAASLTALVEFRGTWTGRCLAQMPDSCARMLTANFAGSLDAGAMDIQNVTELLCELVNVLCGGTIARMNCPGITVLAPPHLLSDWPAPAEEFPAVELWLDANGEPLRLGFYAEAG